MNIVFFKNARQVSLFFLGGFLLFLGIFFWSPYWAIHQIQNAIERNDAKSLVQYVDFYTLQNNTKNTLKKLINTETEKNKNSNEAQHFGQLMFMAFIGQIIEKMVTPEGLVLILKGKVLNDTLNPNNNIETENSTHGNESKPNNVTTITHYESVNRFILMVYTDKQTTSMGFVFYREGFFSWKLADIRFDMANFSTK